MKIKTYFIIAVAIFGLTSCEDLLNNLGATFDSDYYTYQLIIPPSHAGDSVSQTIAVKSDFQDLLKEKGYADATVQDVYLTDVQIDVNDQSQVSNLDAIESVKLSLSSGAYPEKPVAEKENTEKGLTQMPLTLPKVDIAGYLQEDSYNIKVQGVIGEDITSLLAINVKIKFRVDLKLSVPKE